MEPATEDKMVVYQEEDVNSFKGKIHQLEWDNDRLKGVYSSICREHEELKTEKTKIYDNFKTTIVKIIHLQNQIYNQ